MTDLSSIQRDAIELLESTTNAETAKLATLIDRLCTALGGEEDPADQE